MPKSISAKRAGKSATFLKPHPKPHPDFPSTPRSRANQWCKKVHRGCPNFGKLDDPDTVVDMPLAEKDEVAETKRNRSICLEY
jgi:hypothetical protein